MKTNFDKIILAAAKLKEAQDELTVRIVEEFPLGCFIGFQTVGGRTSFATVVRHMAGRNAGEIDVMQHLDGESATLDVLCDRPKKAGLDTKSPTRGKRLNAL
jgi:hypothetical protein